MKVIHDASAHRISKNVFRNRNEIFVDAQAVVPEASLPW